MNNREIIEVTQKGGKKELCGDVAKIWLEFGDAKLL